MTQQTRLSAFKILNQVTRFSLVDTAGNQKFPTEFSRLMAGEKINFLFFTAGKHSREWGIDVAVEASDRNRTRKLIKTYFPDIVHRVSESGILSLFPHRNDPTVAGSLFHVLAMTGIEPEALTCSASAISVVLRATAIEKTTSALFEPFQFSAYRTPADWKLAQEGKETLYKEVVASYQEKRPKTYGLQWQETKNLYRVELKNHDISPMGDAFIRSSEIGFLLPFLTSRPSLKNNKRHLFLCVPRLVSTDVHHPLREMLPEAKIVKVSPVAVFSMNGPHFGDRYGIASELLKAFDEVHVDLLALGCAIASITGVVPAHQLEKATDALKTRFDVPSVIRK